VDVVNSTRRVPLTLFDERGGVPAFKIHVPVESLGWNFYLMALMDSVDSPDDLGVAGRGEFVFGTTELGLTGAWRKDVDPRLGLDVSTAFFDLDLTGEVGLTLHDSGASDDPERKYTLRASTGLEYAVKYTDEDVLYLGAEYFFNQSGYDKFSGSDYLLGLAAGTIQPLYSAKHYAALFMSLPGPGTWNDTYLTLSSIANLSDQSFLLRFDVSQTLLTFLKLQAYMVVPLGNSGELNLGGDALGLDAPNPVAELGLWLRMDL
jgi:hypothetical protein